MKGEKRKRKKRGREERSGQSIMWFKWNTGGSWEMDNTAQA